MSSYFHLLIYYPSSSPETYRCTVIGHYFCLLQAWICYSEEWNWSLWRIVLFPRLVSRSWNCTLDWLVQEVWYPFYISHSLISWKMVLSLLTQGYFNVEKCQKYLWIAQLQYASKQIVPCINFFRWSEGHSYHVLLYPATNLFSFCCWCCML